MQFPIFLVALAYAAGLAVFLGVDDSPRVLLALSFVTLLAGALGYRRKLPRLTLALALTGFCLLGGATIRLEELSIPPWRIDQVVAAERLPLNQAVRVRGWLRRDPVRQTGLYRLSVELESVEQRGRTRKASGGVRIVYDDEADSVFGDTLPPLHYGDRVEMLLRLRPLVRFRNPGSFDWTTYWARQDIYYDGTLRSVLLLTPLPGKRGNGVIRAAQRLRGLLLARLDGITGPGAARNVLHAMLLGDRTMLGGLREEFRLSGAYHVLVISGLHVGIIAFFLFWLLRSLGSNEWAASLATIAALVIYLLIVEDRPPTERAVWMVSLYLLARMFFRDVHLANPAGLAALLVLFAHPRWLFDTSFHFTFAAVSLIAFLGIPWMERYAAPYRRATGFLDAEEHDDHVREPRLAQFRLDLRMIAVLLAPLFFWTRRPEPAAQRLVAGTARSVVRAWEFFLLSLAIHLGLLVLISFAFQQMVWTGLLANIVVVPLTVLIVPMGLAALALPLLGKYLAGLTVGLVSLLLLLVDSLAALPLNYRLPPPPPWLLALYLGTLVVLAVAVNRRRWQRWAAALFLPLFLLVATHPFAPHTPEAALEVTVLDVGQGDAIFLSFPTGETWLVDAGPGPRALPVANSTGSGEPRLLGHEIGSNVIGSFLRARGIKRLDRVWLSHTHHDHIAGLEAVLSEFQVGSVHVGWPATLPSRRVKLLKQAGKQRLPVVTHRAGESFFVGDVRVEIVWPGTAYEPRADSYNDDSLVLRLCRFGRCILLAGDIEAGVERRLSRDPARLRATVLKVPHHGGTDAATSEFLAAVRPRITITSAGARNSHGHPRPATLVRLQASGARNYRTDRDGSVSLRLTRNALTARSFRAGKRTSLYPNAAAKVADCFRRWLP